QGVRKHIGVGDVGAQGQRDRDGGLVLLAELLQDLSQGGGVLCAALQDQGGRFGEALGAVQIQQPVGPLAIQADVAAAAEAAGQELVHQGKGGAEAVLGLVGLCRGAVLK